MGSESRAEKDGDEDQITAKQPFIPPTLIPDLTPSSVASSSILNQHAEQYSSSVSHSVAVSSVTVSSSVEETQSSNITKNTMATEISEKRSHQEDTLVTSKTSTTTNIALAKNDGSSLSDHSQGPDQTSTSDEDN